MAKWDLNNVFVCISAVGCKCYRPMHVLKECESKVGLIQIKVSTVAFGESSPCDTGVAEAG